MTDSAPEPAPLGGRLVDGRQYAAMLHRSQTRTHTATPPTLRLLAVASLGLEAGEDGAMAIAALLHDPAEDQGWQAQSRAIV